MNKEDYQELRNHQPRLIDIYTARRFMSMFYEKNPQRKCDHTTIGRIWDNINCQGKKKQLMLNIEKTKLTCLEYLKSKI